MLRRWLKGGGGSKVGDCSSVSGEARADSFLERYGMADDKRVGSKTSTADVRQNFIVRKLRKIHPRSEPMTTINHVTIISEDFDILIFLFV